MSTKVALNLIYHEVARHLLLKHPLEDISKYTNIPMEVLYRIVENPKFQKLLEDQRVAMYEPLDTELSARVKNLAAEIDKAAVQSFDRLLVLLRGSENENIIRDVAQDFLDRAGYGKSAPIASASVVIDPVTGQMILQALVKEAEGLQANKPIEELVSDGAHLKHPLNRRLGTSTEATPESD